MWYLWNGDVISRWTGHLHKEYSTTLQYSTVQYSTVQYSTVQYSTVQHSTAQHSTAQLLIIVDNRVLQSWISSTALTMRSSHTNFISSGNIVTLIDYLHSWVKIDRYYLLACLTIAYFITNTQSCIHTPIHSGIPQRHLK